MPYNSLRPINVALPNLTAEQVHQDSGLVTEYITSQRTKYGPSDLPLTAEQSRAMGGFVSPQVLESPRLLVLDGERVANPDCYPMLRSLGLNNLPDQSMM